MFFDEESVEKKFHSPLVVQVSGCASFTVDITWKMHT